VRTRFALSACFVLAALTPSACGERSFEAEEFVDEANASGAGIELGEPLTTTESDAEVYALRIVAEHAEATDGEHAHGGGGSLTVTEDDDVALARYEECEAAATLLCYRVANVVVIVEDALPPEDRSRLDAAVSSLASD
jgi:hypothetical protein